MGSGAFNIVTYTFRWCDALFIWGMSLQNHSNPFKYTSIKWMQLPISSYTLCTIRRAVCFLLTHGFCCLPCLWCHWQVFPLFIPNWGRRQGLGSCRFQPRFNEIPVKLPIRKLCVTCTSQGAGRAGRGTLELFYEVFPS